MVFAIHWHESAMDLHVFPIPIPLPIPSLWVFPVHQSWAPVSCIQPGLVICFTLGSIFVSMLFSQNIKYNLFLINSQNLIYTQQHRRSSINNIHKTADGSQHVCADYLCDIPKQLTQSPLIKLICHHFVALTMYTVLHICHKLNVSTTFVIPKKTWEKLNTKNKIFIRKG